MVITATTVSLLFFTTKTTTIHTAVKTNGMILQRKTISFQVGGAQEKWGFFWSTSF